MLDGTILRNDVQDLHQAVGTQFGCALMHEGYAEAVNFPAWVTPCPLPAFWCLHKETISTQYLTC